MSLIRFKVLVVSTGLFFADVAYATDAAPEAAPISWPGGPITGGPKSVDGATATDRPVADVDKSDRRAKKRAERDKERAARRSARQKPESSEQP